MTEVTIEQLTIEFKTFFEKNGRYPTRTEINNPELFSANVKAIERKWGGLRNLRQALGLEITDLTKGSTRAAKAREINIRSYNDNIEIHNQLVDRFSKLFVHAEDPIVPSSPIRTDFRIHHKQGSFCVDIFNASDTQCLNGCANWKIKKYEKGQINTDEPLYLVSMGPTITKENLVHFTKVRKTKIPNFIQLITVDKFTEILGSYEPLMIQSEDVRRSAKTNIHNLPPMVRDARIRPGTENNSGILCAYGNH